MNENKPYMDLDSADDLPDLTAPEWQAKFAQAPVGKLGLTKPSERVSGWSKSSYKWSDL